ncbi:MAG: CPBP family intramembrane metalloprotease [Candidatus Lokiarchaeota archaeon]|nr:CPBP family intramembrane metalloprotease [Candidatus Lokiarchaeota archaeon]MBD3199086.1 CPBP family intramembrane metalloprotease [Candidatus Lokiarchaeota archaeon]
MNYKWSINLIFIILSYAITWSILFPLCLYYKKINLIQLEIWHSLGAIGPAIGGVIAFYILNKRSSLKMLRKGISKYSGRKLLLFAISPILILLISLILESLFGIFNLVIFLEQNSIENFLSLFIFILPSLSYGFFEEIGWRGFFLPYLQIQYNALRSTIIITLIWWFWHFPTFFYRFDLVFALSFMLPLMLSGSIIFTFLYNESRGSLLMTIILHISYDLVTSHQISLIATILVSTIFIFMNVRILKVYGVDSFSTQEKFTLNLL